MRIGVFFNDSNVPSAGGAFTQREAIIEALNQAKTEHEFFYFFYGKKPTDTKISNCVPIKGKIFGWLLKQIYYFTDLGFVKKFIPLNVALKKNKIDLVYFLEPNYQPVLLPYVASVWDIAHLHVPFFPEINSNDEWEKREIMYQRYLRKASYVIATTDAAKIDISKQYVVPEEKVKSIITPVADIFFEKSKVKNVLNKKFNLPEEYFLYPAQLWAHKNHFGIIEALAKIKKRTGKNVHVAFVGSNKGNLDYLKNEAKKLGVEEQVHFLGFVSTDDLIGLYQNATGLLFLSFVDAEGLPITEAFVLGCPIISSNIPCVADQTGSAGITVDPLNTEQLATAMLSLLTNKKLRQSLIKKGNVVAKNLHKERFAKELLDVFDEFALFRKRWE
jgi:glycosyltransferase involved in cell wall biosynthesis